MGFSRDGNGKGKPRQTQLPVNREISDSHSFLASQFQKFQQAELEASACIVCGVGQDKTTCLGAFSLILWDTRPRAALRHARWRPISRQALPGRRKGHFSLRAIFDNNTLTGQGGGGRRRAEPGNPRFFFFFLKKRANCESWVGAISANSPGHAEPQAEGNQGRSLHRLLVIYPLLRDFARSLYPIVSTFNEESHVQFPSLDSIPMTLMISARLL